MSDPLPPGIVFEDDGVHTFMTVDFGRAMDVTDERPGLQGGGYTWAALADAIVTRTDPALREGMTFDPEADTFVVRHPERAPLERLAALFEPYFAEPNTLLDELGPDFGD